MNPTMLNESEVVSLKEALDDEYRSYETYAQVVRDFGSVRPFINIVDAEARHISALLTLFEAYNVVAPANRWMGQVSRFSTLEEACAKSAQGEIDNVAIYDRALLTTQRPDILAVYHALRAASQDRHLPAFRRCGGQRSRGGR